VGGSQEDARRAGTECLHNALGFAKAAEALPALLAKNGALRRRADEFVAAVKAMLPEAVVNSPRGPGCQPGTVSLTLPGFENSHLLGQLDFFGVKVAAGSACRTGANEPSHVLTAMGLSPEEARSTLRLSFGHSLTGRQLRRVIKVFRQVLSGRQSGDIAILSPIDLTEDLLSGHGLEIIHVKRRAGQGGPSPLPGSRVIRLSDQAAWDALESRGPMLLTCEVGYDAPIMAWSLRRRGFKSVSVLVGGLWGLRLARPGFWESLASWREKEAP
jgi:rhodanese-related sulfurtransferase